MLILASRSPRRSELLAAAGISFEVLAADVDETPHPNEAPDAYVERLAIAKARAVFALRPGARVLGADTTVTIDGEILGKPLDEADALRMLRLLNGRPHEVHTGVALGIGLEDHGQPVCDVLRQRGLACAQVAEYDQQVALLVAQPSS